MGCAHLQVRRRFFELFYYSHQFVAVTTVIGALFHATSLWYYLIGGLALWVIDRLVR